MSYTTTPDNARNEEQRMIVEKFKQEGKDPFDRRYVESIYATLPDNTKRYNQIIYENKEWYCMPNLWPLDSSNYHIVMVLQRNNVSSISELSIDEIKGLLSAQRQLMRQCGILTGAFCMRFGSPTKAGTTVTHLHGHLLSAQSGQSIAFPVGKYGTPVADFSENPQHSQLLEKSFAWNLVGNSRDSDHFQIKQEDVSCDVTEVTENEFIDLFSLVKHTIESFPILGGALCMRFGKTENREGYQIYLLSPKQNEKFIFEIKN